MRETEHKPRPESKPTAISRAFLVDIGKGEYAAGGKVVRVFDTNCNGTLIPVPFIHAESGNRFTLKTQPYSQVWVEYETQNFTSKSETVANPANTPEVTQQLIVEIKALAEEVKRLRETFQPAIWQYSLGDSTTQVDIEKACPGATK